MSTKKKIRGLFRKAYAGRGRAGGLLLALYILHSLSVTQLQPAPLAQKKAQAVVPGGIFAAEILWRLGKEAQAKVRAVPAMVDDSRYSDIAAFWPKEMERFMRLSSEALLLLAPDLVILSAFHDSALQHVLRKRGITYTLLEPATGFQAYKNNVRRIALAVGYKRAGENLIMRFEKRLAAIRSKAGKAAPLTVVSYMYGQCAGLKTSIHDSIEAAGFTNLAASKGIQGFAPISAEQILLWKADIVLISCKQGGCKTAEKDFAKNIGLGRSKALASTIVAIASNILGNVNENMLLVAELLQKRMLK